MTPFIGKECSGTLTKIKFTKCDIPNCTLGIELKISEATGGEPLSSPEVYEERTPILSDAFKQTKAELEDEISCLN
jgi:hypothetical protein